MQRRARWAGEGTARAAAGARAFAHRAAWAGRRTRAAPSSPPAGPAGLRRPAGGGAASGGRQASWGLCSGGTPDELPAAALMPAGCIMQTFPWPPGSCRGSRAPWACCREQRRRGQTDGSCDGAGVRAPARASARRGHGCRWAASPCRPMPVRGCWKGGGRAREPAASALRPKAMPRPQCALPLDHPPLCGHALWLLLARHGCWRRLWRLPRLGRRQGRRSGGCCWMMRSGAQRVEGREAASNDGGGASSPNTALGVGGACTTDSLLRSVTRTHSCDRAFGIAARSAAGGQAMN